MKKWSSVLLPFAFLLAPLVAAIGQETCVYTSNSGGLFSLVSNGKATPVLVGSDDDPAVLRTAKDFANDISNVTGVLPSLTEVSSSSMSGLPTTAVIVGSMDSSLIKMIVNNTKMDVSSVSGQWEAYMAATVQNPLPGVSSAYVMIGADRRGAIFAMYEHSEQMGVSPWYWWADVPIKKNSELYVSSCAHGTPTVKYRGIFLNDEQPALQSWAQYTFTNGTGPPMNHYFYSHLFELILRLKANILWPAQWSAMFGVDDLMNQPLANYYGVVMSTSHEEPMMRSTPNEWNAFGSGAYDFNTNAANLTAYWTVGAERAKPYESLYSVGMRGNGDLPLGPSTNIALLENIIATQRQIISSVYNVSDPSVIPQAWCLYKEVESYWEEGMTVPEDITLLWADDNWGNVRRLPIGNETERSGGAGMYYHFDYVGTPRDYKWITSTQISKIWEQMHLTASRQATREWIVNVGDLKPYEMNTEFFLTYAYNTSRWNQDNLEEFSTLWATREFAMPSKSADIINIISNVTMHNARRKPELVNSTTYSVINYNEADNVIATFDALNQTSTAIYNSLPSNMQPAYFQLVHHPLQATYTYTKMYIYAGKNNLYASQARLMTNTLGSDVVDLFEEDYDLEYEYGHLLDSKWLHMMDQTHLGYMYWQQPMQNTMPPISRVQERKTALPGAMRIAIEGSMGAWPGDDQYDCAQQYSCPTGSLLGFDTYGPATRWVDVGAAGPNAFSWTAKSNVSWLNISPASGYIDPASTALETRLTLSVDWSKVNTTMSYALVNFASNSSGNWYLQTEAMPTQLVPFYLTANKTSVPSNFSGFVEGDGYISIEAQHATRNTSVNGSTWTVIPNYGRTLSGVTPFPAGGGGSGGNFTAGTGPALEYDIWLFNGGNISVTTMVSPSLNNNPYEPLGYAVQMDGATPASIYQIPYASAATTPAGWDTPDGFVANSIVSTTTVFNNTLPGKHTFTVYEIEPAVVLQKIIINTGGLRPSYLGPPESTKV